MSHKTQTQYGLTIQGVNIKIVLTFEGAEGPNFSYVSNLIVKALEKIGFVRLS